ncbi:MAG: methylated-DNA--[protein]-cysteine S-methyltransferase [Plectolyngbya sp. WJT66-NPBG17]|jgi:AraC family transcriptional regulator of adaptative response/methylated-DNA-[protein]-cysteine methyltransferase|nr:methylated-DNA--[protein]-cysteine S-methyltransferase [Plectolyngbya sp. WJT66-NPBG17]
MNSSIDTYERIAKAIAFMRQHHLEQPDLATVAHHVHLSEHHFQRLFTEWAGISPKRFLQFLTVEYAKSKIAETRNLFDLSIEVGLSGSGRLHDLFVTLEAMSPGEFKTNGKGLEITYGIHSTPFGQCLIATTPRGICNLHFLDEIETAESVLRSQWANAAIFQDQQATEEICDCIFTPIAGKPLVLFVKGTNFQIQVWRALLSIPPGGMTTYQGLATRIGRPTAARAVGNAIGSNPVGYLIPCHRVIRESGELGGFRWGLERKSVLLSWEAIVSTPNF